MFGIALILVQTRLGPGVNGDTVHYVMGARNLLSGNGYSRISGGGEIIPITGFPPFFSTVLAGLGAVGMDIYDGARILNSLLFGANIFLVGYLIYRYTKSYLPAIVGSALILVSNTQIEFHIMALSEPLFLFLMLSAIYALVRYQDSYDLKVLVFAAVISTLATLTRFVGFSLIGTGVMSAILLSNRQWKRRFSDAALFGGISLLPVAFWFRRNSIASGTLTNRLFSFHPMDPTLVRVFIAEIASWFVPRNLGLPRPVRNLLVGLLALPWPSLFVYQEIKRFLRSKGTIRREFWALPWLVLLNLLFILAVLVINTTFLDAGTPISAPPRYLTPVFACTVIFFVLALHRIFRDFELHPAWRILPLAYAAALVVLYAAQSIPAVKNPLSAIGYSGYMQQRLNAVKSLEAIDEESPIISNNPEMIYVFTDRPAYMWPIQFDHYTLTERQDFEHQVEATVEKLERGGVIVVFGWPVGTEELVFDILGTERFESFIDVTILGYPEEN